MTHPDPDPRYVDPDPLPRFREQRRRSRFGCSVALVAIVAALVVFWATVLFVAVNVFAGERALPGVAIGGQPLTALPAPSSRMTVFALPGRSDPGNPDPPPVTSRIAGIVAPAAASQPAGSSPVSVPAKTGSDAAPAPGNPGSDAALLPAYTGKLGYALPSHGSRYLAIRWPRGTVATLCGPADCVTRTSTDFGPVRSLWEAGRLADLSAVDWQRVCGVELRYGLCQGTLLIVSRPRELPETSTEVRR